MHMPWQVYVFQHAISSHAHESLDDVESEEQSMLHKAFIYLSIVLLDRLNGKSIEQTKANISMGSPETSACIHWLVHWLWHWLWRWLWNELQCTSSSSSSRTRPSGRALYQSG